MRITGIDLGQVGGFFKLDTDLMAVEWGTFEARKGTGDTEGAMFVRLQNRLDEVLADRPDLVTFEDVRFVVPKMRGSLVQVRMGAIVQMRWRAARPRVRRRQREHAQEVRDRPRPLREMGNEGGTA